MTQMNTNAAGLQRARDDRPVLAIGDGALGFSKAVREVFAATQEQRW
jgi:hypothetical protein